MYRVFALALLWLVPLAESGGQTGVPAIAVSGNSLCVGCKVTLVRLATLGGPKDSILLSGETAPVRDSRGRYFHRSFDGFSVLQFDSTGRFIRAIGRQGEGPGEFSRIRSLAIGPGDTLFVRHGSRVSVFSPSFRFVRITPLPTGPFFHLLPLASGNLLYAASLNGPDSWQSVFHLIAAHGGVISSFGRAPPSDSGCTPCIARTPTLGQSGRVWAVQPYRYIVETWTESGALTSSYAVRNSTWFESTDAGVRAGANERPKTFLFAVHAIPQNRVLVFGRRATAAWRPVNAAAGSIVLGGVRATVSATADRNPAAAMQEEFDTFIDVIDLAKRAVVATGQFSAQSLTPIAPGIVYSRRFDADGIVCYDIWRVDVSP
jgi:hypothetical protein